MIFASQITIPANTTESNPTVVEMPIDYGVITEIKVRPRAGHAGLAHLIILYNEIQIAPRARNTSFSGDAFPLDFAEFYRIYQPEFELKLKGWNDDDTYPHTFDVYVTILPSEVILSEVLPDLLRHFSTGMTPILALY